MVCKDCKNFNRIANTDECGEGICVFSPSAIPVKLDSECRFNPKPYTCRDCDRLDEDFACMGQSPDDSAYNEKGELCPGFIDVYETMVFQALYNWRMRGYNHLEKLQKVLEDFNQNAELPF